MFKLLGLLGLLPKIIGAFIEIATPVARAAIEFVIWYFKTFMKGLKATFDNLSVLLVILTVSIGSAWYFQKWDNDKIIKECLTKCPKPARDKNAFLVKHIHPIKYKYIYRNKPVYSKPQAPTPVRKFNDGGN